MFKTFKNTAVCVLLAAIMLTGCSDTDTYGNETVDEYKYFYRLGNSPIVYERDTRIMYYIPDAVDVDGFNSTSKFQPCTPLGVMKIFDSIGYDLDGKNVLVCGQSDIVGRPLVNMLIKRHCNVISVNSTGSRMKATTFGFGMVNVVVSAVGKRNFITPRELDQVEVCIDVGINYDKNGKQHGDCADDVYKMEDIKVTPRIGGVGLMTRAMLLYNVCVAKYGEEKMEETNY